MTSRQSKVEKSEFHNNEFLSSKNCSGGKIGHWLQTKLK